MQKLYLLLLVTFFSFSNNSNLGAFSLGASKPITPQQKLKTLRSELAELNKDLKKAQKKESSAKANLKKAQSKQLKTGNLGVGKYTQNQKNVDIKRATASEVSATKVVTDLNVKITNIQKQIDALSPKPAARSAVKSVSAGVKPAPNAAKSFKPEAKSASQPVRMVPSSSSSAANS